MDRKGLFSIGEVSRLFHISVSSLRHYENVGRLHPEYTSPDTGYRYYGTEQFEVLNTIRYLRALDMPLDTVTLVQIPESRMVWVDAPLKIQDPQDMEAPIRMLAQSQAEAVVFLGKVGLGISAEHLQSAQYEKYDGIFLILDDEDIYDGETMPVAESLCVRLCFRGSHTEASGQYKKLLDYIEKHQMQISGFSREITLIDYGITNDPEKFVTEICIPVRCD